MKERVLIVGKGAREHAIGWKLKQHDSQNRDLFFAPGNGGTKNLGHNVDIEADDVDGLLAFASDNRISLTIVGPEKPLAKGIVNAFSEEDQVIFGHTQEAAELESDKAGAVKFMRRHNISHPTSYIFTDREAAEEFIRNKPWPQLVIKASGLADGKGVKLPQSDEEAIRNVRQMMVEKEFGEAGEKIVIQERLKGKEVSVIGFVSNQIGLLVPARDYKRLLDGDKGPNTGGMGAYAPNDHITSAQLQKVYDEILLPTKKGMEEEGRPLSGVLYAGLMIEENGEIKVIEFNVRLGDPETQVQMRLFKSDLLKTIKASINGRLTLRHYQSSKMAAVGVVLASDGYPGKNMIHGEINGLNELPSDVVVFYGGEIGRQATITAIDTTRELAAEKNYKEINKLGMSGVVYRSGIALN